MNLCTKMRDRHCLRITVIAAILASGLSGSVAAGELPAPATHKVDFTTELQLLFADRCYDCHGAKKQESGLRVDHRADLLKVQSNGSEALTKEEKEAFKKQQQQEQKPIFHK